MNIPNNTILARNIRQRRLDYYSLQWLSAKKYNIAPGSLLKLQVLSRFILNIPSFKFLGGSWWEYRQNGLVLILRLLPSVQDYWTGTQSKQMTSP